MNALNSPNQSIAELTRKGGIALILGSLINLLRVVPIFLSDGVSSENFPPQTAEDIAFAAQLPLWTITHVLALFGVVLMILGVTAFARAAEVRGETEPGLMAQIGVTLSMILLTLGLVSDGIILPLLIEKLTNDGGVDLVTHGPLIEYAHLFATSFGGIAATILLISATFIGITLLRAFDGRILGGLGIAIGSVSLLGYITGVLSLNITPSLHLTGPLTVLMFLYLIAVGAYLLRHSPHSIAN